MSRYLEVELPERFALEFQRNDGTWMHEAVCVAHRFERLEDGSYLCSEFSSAVWIRCVAHHDGYFEHIDGGGEGKVQSLPLGGASEIPRRRLGRSGYVSDATGSPAWDSSISRKGEVAARSSEIKGSARRASGRHVAGA